MFTQICSGTYWRPVLAEHGWFDIKNGYGTLQTYTIGLQEGHYQSVMGPIVGFWGGLGGAFDQLGMYVDPDWWPDRPTRMLKIDLHGRLRSYPNWTHFDHVNALSNPFVVRMAHIIVSYNDTGIFVMSVTWIDVHGLGRHGTTMGWPRGWHRQTSLRSGARRA